MKSVVATGTAIALSLVIMTGCRGNDGANGSSCTVDGGTFRCDDGTSITLYNGRQGPTGPDGAAGPQGPAGEAGPAGLSGAAGEAGTSCSVQNLATGNVAVVCTDGNAYLLPNAAGAVDGGTCTVAFLDNGLTQVRCPDGTFAVLKNGSDGLPGVNGSPGQACYFVVTSGALTSNCGGVSTTFDHLKAFISSGPQSETTLTSATFAFGSSWWEDTRLFCLLDAVGTTSPAVHDGDPTCQSPKTYESLGPGSHTFTVVAVYVPPGTSSSSAIADAVSLGNWSSSVYSWRIGAVSDSGAADGGNGD